MRFLKHWYHNFDENQLVTKELWYSDYKAPLFGPFQDAFSRPLEHKGYVYIENEIVSPEAEVNQGIFHVKQ